VSDPEAVSLHLVVSVHDPPVWSIPPEAVERLRRALPGVPIVDARTAAERLEAFPTADVLIATRISAEEFARAGRVKWIHTTAVGVGGLLPRPVVDSPVVVTNTRGVHAEALAEHAIALALAVRRRVPLAAAAQAERAWIQEQLLDFEGPPLRASCLLVVGLGAIGGRVAAHGAGLGMRVLGIRRRPDLPAPSGVAEVGDLTRLPEWLGRADVVVLALPHTDETRVLVGERELGAMRRHAVLVNVARGGLVDEAALARAILDRTIAGAGLDAFVREPLAADSPLWGLPNVLITPHSASFGGDYWGPVIDLFLQNLERFNRGEPLLNVVDKVHRY
jgi:phosphoglycerate dehydrogenase-like enzyme